MAALLDAQYGPTSVDEEQEMVVLQARKYVMPNHRPITLRSCCPLVLDCLATAQMPDAQPMMWLRQGSVQSTVQHRCQIPFM